MQATQSNFFSAERAEINAMQRQFLNVLYHDATERKGRFLKAQYRPSIRETWTTNIAVLESDTESADTYVAINSFHGQSRKASNVHTINAIFFDLDYHEPCSNDELDLRIDDTLEVLQSAANNGRLPRPTMVTKTGRGLGLFYVLEKSIANTPNTQKSIRFWKNVSNGLAKLIEHVLTDAFYRSDQVYALLELDWKVVADVSRVCRLPGTTNSKVRRICMLEDVYEINGQPIYYSLFELAQYIPAPETKDKPAVRSAGGNVIDFCAYREQPMLYRRMEKLKRAQKVFFNKTGNRELLCFYYYNTVSQIYTPLEAQDMLYSYNNGFSNPIEAYELENIIRSVSSATDQAGEVKGFYKLTDAYISEKLGINQMLTSGELTQEQADYIGFGRASKQLLRELQKEENKKRREARNREIAECIINSPEKTYKEIAGLFEVSERTVKNIAKVNNIRRYEVSEAVDEVLICDAQATDNISTDILPEVMETNVQKTAPVSNGVCVIFMWSNILDYVRAFSRGGLLVSPTTYVRFSALWCRDP